MSSSLWKNWKTLYTVGFLRVVTAAAKSSQHWICYVIPKKAIVLMHVDRLTSRSASDNGLNKQPVILYNFPPKGRWIVVDIYRDAKGRGIYPPLITDPERDSCFSIYQIRCIKKYCFNFFFWNFRETMLHFSLRSQNSVTGTNQNARKLLSTDLVNTNLKYARISLASYIYQLCDVRIWNSWIERNLKNMALAVFIGT